MPAECLDLPSAREAMLEVHADVPCAILYALSHAQTAR